MATAKKSARISDESVKEKTGRDWNGWFALLDQAGATKMTHKEIVAVLAAESVSPWWQQMITVTYEQARGLRAKHEVAGGYSISRSRTIKADVEPLFEAWEKAAVRRKWLGVTGLTIRKATPNKSIRITWPDETNVEVLFYPKGPGKTQVVVSHGKLKDAKSAEAQKSFWSERLDALEAFAEKA